MTPAPQIVKVIKQAKTEPPPQVDTSQLTKPEIIASIADLCNITGVKSYLNSFPVAQLRELLVVMQSNASLCELLGQILDDYAKRGAKNSELALRSNNDRRRLERAMHKLADLTQDVHEFVTIVREGLVFLLKQQSDNSPTAKMLKKLIHRVSPYSDLTVPPPHSSGK